MNLDNLDLDNLNLGKFADQITDEIEAVITVRDAVERGDWEFLYRVVFGYEVKEFHRKWVNFQLNNRFTVIAGPRGFGKTVVCTKGYTLLKSVASRELRILIVGKTLPQARKVMREIRLQLQRNDLMKIFGKFFGDDSVDTGTELLFEGRQSLDSEPNISCIGIGSSKVGGHYDIILCEDLVDEANSSGRNAELLRGWVLEELIGMLMPHGEMHFIQSRYGVADLWVDLENTGIFEMTATAALVDKQGRPSLNGQSIWEEMISTEELQRRRRLMGNPYFQAQYQQNPKQLGKLGIIRFNKDAMEVKKLSEINPLEMQKCCGVDLGASLGRVGARTVFTVVGRSESDESGKNLKDCILDIQAEQWGLGEIDAVFNLMEEKWGPELQFRVESNAIQLLIANDQADKHDVDPVNTSESRSKRRQKLAIKINSGRVCCVEGLDDDLKELWEYPEWYRQDVIDSVDLALDGFDDEDGEGDFDSIPTEQINFRGVSPRGRAALLELLESRTGARRQEESQKEEKERKENKNDTTES